MAGDEITVLVVCTANQCRSPVAAAALRAHSADLTTTFVVASAGVSAVPGMPATPPTVEAAQRIGLDLSEHESTPLDSATVEGADLVIGLERRHVQEVVVADPTAFGRSFTLKELVRRGAEIGPRQAGDTVAAWLEQVHAGRRPLDLLGTSDDDDVADPTGSAATDHRTSAEEIDALVAEVVVLLVPDAADA